MAKIVKVWQSQKFGQTVEIKLAPKAKPSSGLRAWPTKRDAFHSFFCVNNLLRAP